MNCISIWMVIALLNLANCKYDRIELINWYNDAKSYEKEYYNGHYQVLNFSDTKLLPKYSNDAIKDCINKSCSQHKCFFTYNMLVFMHSVRPENYTRDDNVIVSIESVCPKWGQKMLKARIDTNYFKESSFSAFTWVFYFYTYQMKRLASADENEERINEMKKLYKKAVDYVSGAMPARCHIDLGEPYRYYQLHRILEHNSTQGTLEQNCKRLSSIGTDVEGFDFDRLYLNTVIEDNEIMDTLTTSFGGLSNSKKIVDLLSSKMELVKNPKTSLGVIIGSLQSVHIYFIQMLKTIMLRICWTFLNCLKSLKSFNTTQHVDPFKVHLVNFADLIELDSADHFRKLINQLNGWAKTHSFFFIVPMLVITYLLGKYDKYGSIEKIGNDKIESLEKIIFKSSQNNDKCGANNTKAHKVMLEKKIRDGIYFAENFVDYLKKVLKGVNFKVIQFFIFEIFPIEKDFFSQSD